MPVPDPSPTADLVIHMNDITKAGYCARGAREWFAAYDLDFRAFLRDNQGIPADALLATGDALAVRVVEAKLRELTPDG